MSQRKKNKIWFAVAVAIGAIALNIGLFFFSSPIFVVIAIWLALIVVAAQLVNELALYSIRRKLVTQAPSVSRSPDSPNQK